MLVPVLAIGGLLLLAGMGGSKPRRASPTPATPGGPTPKRGTGNGKDVEAFCVARGGRVEEMQSVDGQKVLMCVFADGKMVEAAAYARGEAQPQCPVDMTFDMATGQCVAAPAPSRPKPRPPTPAPQPSGPDNLQVCEERLVTNYVPFTADGLNLGPNWAGGLYAAYMGVLTGRAPTETGAQSMVSIWNEGLQAGDPKFQPFAEALAPGVSAARVEQKAMQLAGLGLIIFTNGECNTAPLVGGGMPPFGEQALGVWASVVQIAEQAVLDYIDAEPTLPPITPSAPPRPGAPPSITPSAPPRPAPPLPGVGDDLPPRGPNPNATGYGDICPPNFAYNALHDVCCPDGFSYDVRSDICKPTAFVGAARHNLPVDRRGAPRRDWGPMGGVTKVPAGTIAIKRRDGRIETKSLAGFAGSCGSPRGCRAKWVPNRGQRMGNRRN